MVGGGKKRTPDLGCLFAVPAPRQQIVAWLKVCRYNHLVDNAVIVKMIATVRPFRCRVASVHDIDSPLVVVGVAKAVQAWEGLRELEFCTAVREATCAVCISFGAWEIFSCGWINSLAAVADKAPWDGDAGPFATARRCPY